MNRSEHKLETKLGVIFLTPTSDKHIHADANHHSASPQAPDHHPPLTVNGAALSVSAHLYRHSDGKWRIGPESNDWSTKYNALHARKMNSRSYADSPASEAARRKITEVLEAAVQEWVANHGPIMIAAMKEDRQERLQRALDKVADIKSALDKVADIKADLVEAQKEVSQIVAETDYAPSPVEDALRQKCGVAPADVEIENEGTIFLFRPRSSQVEEWLRDHTSDDAQWFGNALVVEHRFARDLADGLREAGFRVE